VSDGHGHDAGTRVTLGVRPEDLEPGDHGLRIEVDVVEETGADAYVYGHVVGATGADIRPAPGQAVDTDGHVQLVARVPGEEPPAKGQTVCFAAKPGRVHLFDSATGLRIESEAAAPV
jgi:multiple sugar transport system ATP-binding protein